MQTITTKYLGPTNTKGGRIKAVTTSGKSLTKAYRPLLSQEENHFAVACELALSLDWQGSWVQGETKNGYVHVLWAGKQQFRCVKQVQSKSAIYDECPF